MAIYIGNNPVSGIHIGTNQIQQVYVGQTLVYSNNGYVPPSPTPTPTNSPTATVTPTKTPTLTSTPTPSSSSTINMGIVIQTNTANFGSCADWNGIDGIATDVGTNGISSSYGTYDQSGNIWEWTEATVGSSRVFRGGNWQYSLEYLSAAYRNYNSPSIETELNGGRIASYNNDLTLPHFAIIQDINNPPDNTGYGSVSYVYYIGKYELTNSQYVEFLNAVATTDSRGLFNIAMSNDARGGISRSGFQGNYSYSTKTNMANKPVNYISWFDLARYCNWLHNSKPSGAQTSSTTENGAYDLSQSIVVRKPEAKYFIPSEDEWYKAAFYKTGSNAGYWEYATRSDSPPTCVNASSTGSGATI